MLFRSVVVEEELELWISVGLWVVVMFWCIFVVEDVDYCWYCYFGGFCVGVVGGVVVVDWCDFF